MIPIEYTCPDCPEPVTVRPDQVTICHRLEPDGTHGACTMTLPCELHGTHTAPAYPLVILVPGVIHTYPSDELDDQRRHDGCGWTKDQIQDYLDGLAAIPDTDPPLHEWPADAQARLLADVLAAEPEPELLDRPRMAGWIGIGVGMVVAWAGIAYAVEVIRDALGGPR